MSVTARAWGRGPSDRYEQLAHRFRPVFARIAAGAVAREVERILPYEQIAWLKAVGFGALRVPEAHGGSGATLPELFALLIELGEADSNLPQILRNHFGFVEDLLVSRDEVRRRKWFAHLAAGDIFGGAFTERSGAKAGTFATTILPNGDRWVLNGEKYYSTGSLFADWIEVVGTGPEEKILVAVVATDASGVTQEDDWNGFGQRLTASGTSRYIDVPVAADAVQDGDYRFKYQTAYYQLVHLATLTGISRAAAEEVTHQVAKRTRTYTHAAGPTSRLDPQVLQVVGQVHSAAYAAGAVTLKAAEAAQAAFESAFLTDEAAEAAANLAAEIESSEAQIIVANLVLQSTSALFNALGASATSRDASLDRHWRNARTIASHNPLIYKERVVGDYAVNQTAPPYLWLPGESEAAKTDPRTQSSPQRLSA